MATDYFAAKRAQLAPVTPNKPTTATAFASQGNTAGSPAGSPLIKAVAAKVKTSPFSTPSTGTTSTKTTAQTAPIANAVTSTTTPATGFGGASYGSGAAANNAIMANQAALKNDPNFVQSEIARTQGVIQQRQAQGLDTSAQQKYLTTNLGYKAPVGADSGVPDWVTAQANMDYNNQLAALQGLQGTYRDQLASALNQNDQYVAKQIDSAQQLQNRRGGLYSGGYDYQAGTLTSAGLQRQADLQNQYGAQLNDVATQIANLQTAQPGLIQEKINAYLDRQFDKDMATKKFNVDTALQYSDRAGQILSPQSDPTGYIRQINNGTTSAGTPITKTLEASNADRNYNYNVGRDAVADAKWKAEFDQRVAQDGIANALSWAQQTLNQNEYEDNSAYKWAGLDADLAAAANQGTKYEGMTANQIVENVRKNLGDADGKITADQADAAYLQVINSGLPEDQENQALAAVGLTKNQIDAFDKKYLSPK